MVDQVSSRPQHPPCPATGAEPSALAGESNEVLVTAAIAIDAQKAMFKQTALETVLELLAYKRREMSTMSLQGGINGRVVPLDELIRHCLFRPVPRQAIGC